MMINKKHLEKWEAEVLNEYLSIPDIKCFSLESEDKGIFITWHTLLLMLNDARAIGYIECEDKYR